jgi:hypothetical protein
MLCDSREGYPTLTLRPRAGAPFVVANTLVGGLAAYGLAGLRPGAWAVGRFALVLALQSLVAVQVMVLSVFLTPNQARRARRGRHHVNPALPRARRQEV